MEQSKQNIETKLKDLLSSKEKVQSLLKQEKNSRGLQISSLQFIGMANIAEYWWCAMKSVLKSRKEELLYFESYLYDRITYSAKLGLISDIPENEESLLHVGDEITLNDIEKILEERKKFLGRVMSYWEPMIITNSLGKKVAFINPALPEEVKVEQQELMESEGCRIAKPEEFNASLLGEMYHETDMESYPTIRWNFKWGRYVVVGIPDGITDDFVYEYKTTKDRFLLTFSKPVAMTQADLYGYFFNRKQKRVQIRILSDNSLEAWVDIVDQANVEKTLQSFSRVDSGKFPIPPKPWKCNCCELQQTCMLMKNSVSKL